MFSRFSLLNLLFLAVAKQSVGNNNGQLRSRNALNYTYGEVVCTMVMVMLAIDPDSNAGLNDEEQSYWVCEDENMMTYRMPTSALPLNKAELVSGKTRIVVSQAGLTEGTSDQEPSLLVNPASSVLMTIDGGANRRKLAPKTGTNSLLVVRCSTSDGSPSRSAGQISDDVFGQLIPGQTDSVNLASQMDACSGGVLTFEPATGNNAIENGAVDISITQRSNGVSRSSVQNWCLEELQNTVGRSDQWDHVYMVLPNNVDFGGAAAVAFVNHRISVYKDVNGSYLTVSMHEVGHNLGMFHSGKTKTYDDHTCMMGNPAFGDDRPLMCFNGQKSWFLGWYSDRHESINPTNAAWRGALIGVDDYVSSRSSSSDEFVVVQVQAATDLYIMYNKAQGVNSEVQHYANQVTVVSGNVDSSVARESTLLDGLSSGDEFRRNDFAGSNLDLVIKVCSLGGVANVIIYIDGMNNISCDPEFEDDRDNEDQSSGGSCFPSDANVVVKGRGEVPMKELAIGDMVKVADGSFEPIYSFCKKDTESWVDYLLIHTADLEKPLALTPNHMVFISKGSQTRATEGRRVRIGDNLVLENGAVTKVVRTSYERKRGFYAPFTFSGTIIVDQIKASVFATTTAGPLSLDSPWLQSVYWLSQAHHRLLCRISWNICQEEGYTSSGMSNIVEWSLKQYEKINGLSIGAQMVVGVPIAVALLLAVIVENQWAVWAALTISCCAGYLCRRKSSKSRR